MGHLEALGCCVMSAPGCERLFLSQNVENPLLSNREDRTKTEIRFLIGVPSEGTPACTLYAIWILAIAYCINFRS